GPVAHHLCIQYCNLYYTKIDITMKPYYQHLYNKTRRLFSNLINKIMKSKDDDDSHFNHPWAIF
ncbi:MAG: hypothetical protein ABUT20_59375, partial [Bacteroidota bacterium]